MHRVKIRRILFAGVLGRHAGGQRCMGLRDATQEGLLPISLTLLRELIRCGLPHCLQVCIEIRWWVTCRIYAFHERFEVVRDLNQLAVPPHREPRAQQHMVVVDVAVGWFETGCTGRIELGSENKQCGMR